jgi:acyl-CoA thioesterase
MGDFAFDADTRVMASSDRDEFAAELTGRWNGTNGAVNGGYMLAICLRALGLRMQFPDPIVVSGFFLRPGTAGPAVIGTTRTRSGRTTAFGEAVLSQGGKDVVRAGAAFAALDGAAEPAFVAGVPPDLPAPQECVGVPVGSFGLASIAERVEFRFASLPGWFRGEPTGRPASEFWMRFADGREADLYALPLLVDSTAPSVLELGMTSTTVQLTVHLRAHPAPGWLACRAAARFVSGGYHEEDFEVWDSAGRMVAQSRQLAMILGLRVSLEEQDGADHEQDRGVDGEHGELGPGREQVSRRRSDRDRQGPARGVRQPAVHVLVPALRQQLYEDRNHEQQPDHGGDGPRGVPQDGPDREREQAAQRHVQRAADHGTQHVRLGQGGGVVRAAQQQLAEEERDERGDEGDR